MSCGAYHLLPRSESQFFRLFSYGQRGFLSDINNLYLYWELSFPVLCDRDGFGDIPDEGDQFSVFSFSRVPKLPGSRECHKPLFNRR